MPSGSLSEARIKRLKPRRCAYEVRDAKLKGFGVRVLPSGAKRFFVHTQHNGKRSWQTVADANAVDLNEARSRAEAMLGTLRGAASTQISLEETLFESVAEAVFQRYARVWKPRTLEVNRSYLRRQILPSFAGRQVADITRRDVQRWFASLRATPGSANRAAPVLSIIFKEATLLGYRPEESNPCRRLRRYRRNARERYLSNDEFTRLATVLSDHEAQWPQHVAAVRLLALTGCRRNEILSLRWSDYREGHLFLPDSKTGPRAVHLSAQARQIIDRQCHGASAYVFPSPRKAGCPRSVHLPSWNSIRRRAGIEDVRLHDLRHNFASHAVMNGVPVPVVSRLLGHSNVRMTLRYSHLAEKDIEAAAERVGTALARILALE